MKYVVAAAALGALILTCGARKAESDTGPYVVFANPESTGTIVSVSCVGMPSSRQCVVCTQKNCYVR